MMDSRQRRLVMTMAALSLATIVVVPPRRDYQAEPEFKSVRRNRRDHPTLADALGKRRFTKSSKRHS